MWKFAASVFVCTALAVTPIALAQTGANPSQGCTPIKVVYSESNWQQADPGKGVSVCPTRLRAGTRNTVAHFYLYRRYREATPYRCGPGNEGTWAIPCSIIECESHFYWGAANPSGAVGPYQLLGWGAPYPARTFRQRAANHLIAARVWAGGAGRSQWVC